jgi:hypothetical protein
LQGKTSEGKKRKSHHEMEKVKRGASPYWSGDTVTIKSKSKVTTVHVKVTWLVRTFYRPTHGRATVKQLPEKTRGIVKS